MSCWAPTSLLRVAVIIGVASGTLSSSPAAAEDRARAPADTAKSGNTTKLRIPARSLAQVQMEPPLAPEVAAGTIARSALRAELARGIGAFLRHVRMRPALDRGRFVGWRVVELFPQRPEIRVLVLRRGDTIRRVNGRSVERPEDFKLVWDGLADATELVLDIQRDGNPSKLRYAIVD